MQIKAIQYIYFLAMSLIVLRLGYWQIVQADFLSARADSQHLLTREVIASRGDILFNDGSIIATNQPSYLLFVQPKLIEQKKGTDSESLELYKKDFSEKIAQVLFEESEKRRALFEDTTPVSTDAAILESEKLKKEEEAKKRLEDIKNLVLTGVNKNLQWVSLGRKVNFEIKGKLEKLNLVGLGFERSSARFYPEGSSSAHILGFVSADAYNEEKGYFGIEGLYDGELKGQKGVYTQEKDALGLPILIGKFLGREPQQGKVLTLNIDRTVQHIVEEKLSKGMQKYGAKSGSVVIMEPQTGAILAMAAFPSYDPANVLDYPKENFRNPITADGYEPGSTFKVLVMAAGVNEGVVDANTVCSYCSGPLEISGYTIKTWNNKYQDSLTMTDAIIHSDNTGMVFTSRKLGQEKLVSYIKNFGFGKTTGIDLQDELTPQLREDDDWKEIDLATASFGQGISVTALQVVRAVGSIANGGKLMEPQIVKSIKEENGTEHIIKPRVVSEPIKKQAADVVTEMMVRAVDEGEAKFAKPKGFKIAGKTGTAQIPVAGHYDANKTIASFVGFAPADNPKFVMLVRFDEPQSSIFGAETAAPTFFEIAKELFTYYGIAPTEQ